MINLITTIRTRLRESKEKRKREEERVQFIQEVERARTYYHEAYKHYHSIQFEASDPKTIETVHYQLESAERLFMYSLDQAKKHGIIATPKDLHLGKLIDYSA